MSSLNDFCQIESYNSPNSQRLHNKYVLINMQICILLFLLTNLLKLINSENNITLVIPLKSYMLKNHPFLEDVRLSESMNDLLDSNRQKRQFYLYQDQNAVHTSNLGIPWQGIPIQPQEATSAKDSQQGNPQYILLDANSAMLQPATTQAIPTTVTKDSKTTVATSSRPLTTLHVTSGHRESTSDTKATLKHNFDEIINFAADTALRNNDAAYTSIGNINKQLKTATLSSYQPFISNSLTTKYPLSINLNNIKMDSVAGHDRQRNIDNMLLQQCDQFETTTANVEKMDKMVFVPPPTNPSNTESASSPASPPPVEKSGGNDVAQVIQEIKVGVAQLKNEQLIGKKEGLPCPLVGKWQSTIAGVIFNIPKESDKETKVNVTDDRAKEGFFKATDWVVTAITPFKNIGLLVLTAIHEVEFHMATFSGECRICQGKEAVTGHWLIVKNESTCVDLNKGQDFFGDTWFRKY